MTTLDLAAAVPSLSLIALGVGLVAWKGRDQHTDANQHDLSDYFEQAPERSWDAVNARLNLADWPALDRKPMPGRRAARRQREALVESIVPTLPDAAIRGIADEWLRELGEQAQAALAGGAR